MAVKKSGVKLVAENFSTYMKQLKAVNKANAEAFSPSHLTKYIAANKKAAQQSKKLKSSTDDTWKAVQNLRNKFNEAAGGADKLSGSSSRLSGIFGGVRGAFGGATTGVKNLVGGLGGLISKLGIVIGLISSAMAIVNFGKAAVEVAARNETLRVSLVTVAKSYGITIDQVDWATEQLKKQGITTSAAQSSLLRMARANISWAEASKLAAIAQGAAAGSAMTSSDAFNRLILGIQKMEPELLDELGITLQRSVAYDKLAKTLGKNSKQLTEQEKKQAILNEIYRQSESVIDVYAAAMETAGKKQGSLVRKVEEAQNNFGQMLLPLKAASIEMKTNFWNGMQLLTKGLALWGPIIKIVIEELSKLVGVFGTMVKSMLGLKQSVSIFEVMGRGAQQWGQMFVTTGALIRATVASIRETYIEFTGQIAASTAQIAEAFRLLGEGDFGGAAAAFQEARDTIGNLTDEMGSDFKDKFGENAKRELEAVKAKFPELFTAWEELGIVAEVSLDTIKSGTEEATAALEEQKKALEAEKEVLEARVDALKKVEQIQKNFNKQMEAENKRHTKAMADENKRFAKAQADEQKNFQKAMEAAAKKRDEDIRKLERDAADQRRQMTEDTSRTQVQDQKKLFFDLSQERRRFELSQLQATRRFKIQDRRLRSEGDILALIDLREDFKLQQKENKENFGLGQTEQKDNLQQQQTAQQEELAVNLKRLQEETTKRRDEINRSFAQETEDLRTSHTERMTEIEQQHAERLIELQQHHEERKTEITAARDEELAALGEALQEEGKITKEGMEQIAGEISEVFGDEGAGDALIKGWSERTNSEIAMMIDETKAQIAELEAALANASANLSANVPSSQQNAPTGMTDFARLHNAPIPMRQGGIAKAIGPATFTVEPGQREAIMFAPLPAMQNKLDVNMSGGFDIKGGEAAGKANVETALDMMTEEFMLAVGKMGRRGTR